METVSLSVQVRSHRGKGAARKIRAQGLIPAIVYGPHFEPITLTVEEKPIRLILSSASGMNSIIRLEIAGSEPLIVMLKDYQINVISRALIHLDFLKIDLAKKIKVEVPIHVIGKAEGVKDGGILDVIRHSLPLFCFPTAIPKQIDVDVSSLKIGQSLHLHDLKLPEGVEASADIDFTLVSVVAPKDEKISSVVAGPQEPEVLTAKKPAAETAEKGEGKAEKKK